MEIKGGENLKKSMVDVLKAFDKSRRMRMEYWF